MLHENIKKLYLSTFFSNLIFAYVIERLFWQSRGMTALMVVYTEIIYAVTITILEIPTGILADKFSKKKMLIISSAIDVIALVILVFANDFLYFAIAVFIAGIGSAMSSGTQNALLYESLKSNNNQSSFEKCLGRLNAVDFTAGCIAALLGGFLANRINFEFNYYISIVSAIIALIITFTLKDIKITKSNDKKTKVLRKSINTLKTKPILILAIVSFCILAVSIIFVDEFWQLYLSDLSIPVMYFGLFSVFMIAARIPGNLFVNKLLKHMKHLNILLWVLILMTISLILSAIFSGYIGIIFILLVFILDGLVEPVITGFLHHRIQSDVRATMDSFLSLATRFVLIPVGLGFGFFVSNRTIKMGFGYLGVVLLFYSIVYLIIYIKMNSKKESD